MEVVASDEFQNLSILKQAVQVSKSSPKAFILMTVCFILPLFVVILAHSSLISSASHEVSTLAHEYIFYTNLFFYNVITGIPLFTFTLLSTSTAVFIVTSTYTFKTNTFHDAFSALPRVFPRVLITFLWISLFMILFNAFFRLLALIIPFEAIAKFNNMLACLIFTMGFAVLLLLQVYSIAVWQLSSVVSVVELIYGLAAIKKSSDLLQGKKRVALTWVAAYLILCEIITFTFNKVVGAGAELGISLWVRVLVGGVLLILLVLLILVGLVAQRIFYYVSKSFHQENIDVDAMQDLLGWYVKPQVKLNTMI